jgi:hypothetical protein
MVFLLSSENLSVASTVNSVRLKEAEKSKNSLTPIAHKIVDDHTVKSFLALARDQLKKDRAKPDPEDLTRLRSCSSFARELFNRTDFAVDNSGDEEIGFKLVFDAVRNVPIEQINSFIKSHEKVQPGYPPLKYDTLSKLFINCRKEVACIRNDFSEALSESFELRAFPLTDGSEIILGSVLFRGKKENPKEICVSCALGFFASDADAKKICAPKKDVERPPICNDFEKCMEDKQWLSSYPKTFFEHRIYSAILKNNLIIPGSIVQLTQIEQLVEGFNHDAHNLTPKKYFEQSIGSLTQKDAASKPELVLLVVHGASTSTRTIRLLNGRIEETGNAIIDGH